MRIISPLTPLFLLFLLCQLGMGRPVGVPSLEELEKSADLVVVIQPESTVKATDQLTSAGPRYGARDPKNYQALNTRFKVLLVLKRSKAIQTFRADQLIVLHFCYSAGPVEFNGGLFAYFHCPPTQFQTISTNHPSRSIAAGPPVYLAFLRHRADGRFEAATGNYDSELSFRVLTTPQGGSMLYGTEGVPGSEREGESPLQP